MVTADFAKGAAVTLLAIGGMLVGFKVQDVMRVQREADIERRVEAEYQRRLAERAAKAGASTQAAPVKRGMT